MTAISALLGTVAPSSTRISRRMPSNGDGTSALTLSVMTSSERLVLVDVVAGLLEPLPDRALGDALAELGHRHLGHVRRSSEVRAASSGTRWVVPRSVAHLRAPVESGRRGPLRRPARLGIDACHGHRPVPPMNGLTTRRRHPARRGPDDRPGRAAVRVPRGRPRLRRDRRRHARRQPVRRRVAALPVRRRSAAPSFVAALAYGAALGRLAAHPAAGRPPDRRGRGPPRRARA